MGVFWGLKVAKRYATPQPGSKSLLRYTWLFVVPLLLSLLFLLASAPVFAAGPSVTVSPAFGPPGTSATVTGVGFAPKSDAAVMYDSAFVNTSTTDGAGNVTFIITIPASAATGSHEVAITDGKSTASALFEVTSANASSPTPVSPAPPPTTLATQPPTTAATPFPSTPASPQPTSMSNSPTIVVHAQPSSNNLSALLLLLIIPLIAIPVVVTYVFFPLLWGSVLLGIFRRCSRLRIWLENLMCREKARAAAKDLEWLVYTSGRLDKQTQLVNGKVDAYEKALASVVNDVNGYAQSLADYNGMVNDLQTNGYIETDDPRARNLPPGSGGIYQSLRALHDDLTEQATKINIQLHDLLSEYNSLEYVYKEIKDDEAQLKAKKAKFIADLKAFLATLKCVSCSQVANMIAQAERIKDTFNVKEPSLAPPDPVAAPGNPPTPPQPPAGGGGAGQTQEKEREKACECKIDHAVKDEPIELIVSMVTLDSEFADLNAREDNNSHYAEWTFGGDYHDISSSREGVPLRAHAVLFRKVDVKVSNSGGASAPSSTDLQLVIPLAGIDCSWSLDEVKNIDSNEAAKNVKVNLLLRGPGGASGQKVQGSAVMLPLSYDDQYVDWFVESPMPHYEGKFVDFEARMTVSATRESLTATKKIVLTAKGKRNELAEGGVKHFYDAYNFTMKVDPANNWDAGRDLLLLDGPTWNQNGTKVEVAKTFVAAQSVDEGCTLQTKWSAVTLDMQAAETSVKMREWETHLLPLTVKSSAILEVWTSGNCKPDRFQLTNVPVDYLLEVKWNPKANPLPRESLASSDTLIANGRDPILYAQSVDSETEYDVEISVRFSAFGQDPVEKSVHITVTVAPYRDMRDWYGDKHILDKLATLGAIRAEDKDKMQLWAARDTSLWEYADMGLKIYGLKVKAERGYSNVRDRFKAVGKDAIYSYELSAKFPNADFRLLGTDVKLGTPDFAPVPSEMFAKLHPLKRVVEPLVGTARLGELLTESTGRDYFFKEGSMATFNQAWENYFKNVYRRPGDADWTVPDEAAVAEMVKNVRFGRLRQSAALRVNEIIKIRVAAERGVEYKPSLPIRGTPQVVLSQFTNPKTGVTKPELAFLWTEQTKLGEPQRFKITMEVETQVVGGITKVKQTGKFVNFLMELSEEQRVVNNGNLARLQVVGPTYGSGSPPPPRPAPGSAQTVDDLFDLKQTDLALQSWKNWACDTAFKRATGSAVNSALVYTLTNAYTDLIVEANKNGLGSAAWKFGLGIAAASGKSFVTQGLLDFGTKLAAYSAEALRVQEERYLMAFGKFIAKEYAQNAARTNELLLAEKLVEAGRIPFMAGRWTLSRAIPVIGWGLLLYDIGKMTDSISKALGEMIFGPDRTPEQEAWLNPLYATRQDQVGEYYVVGRGLQLKATNVIDDDLTAMSKKRGVSNILNMPEGATIYKTLFDSRATKFIFKDGTQLEMADEVVGPNTEWLPAYMRERLPALLPERYSGQFPDPRDTQAYDIAKDKWWFYLNSEKTGHVVNKADSATLDKMSEAFAQGAWTNLDPVDAAYSFMLWGAWRDKNATKWVQMKSGDRNNPYFLTWWRDYTGKECKVMEHAGQLTIQPRVGFDDLLSDVTPPK